LSNTAIPTLADLESIDLLDHVIFVFQKNRLWGSIARSRDLGLHGRKPVFRSLRQLVWSYFEPYIDMTGRIKVWTYELYELGITTAIQFKNMHKIEDHLRAIPHKKLRSPISDTITGTIAIRNSSSGFQIAPHLIIRIASVDA